MAVLLLFETTDEMCCKELRETLQLSADQFQKHAASLVDCKMLTSDSEVSNIYLLSRKSLQFMIPTSFILSAFV